MHARSCSAPPRPQFLFRQCFSAATSSLNPAKLLPGEREQGEGGKNQRQPIPGHYDATEIDCLHQLSQWESSWPHTSQSLPHPVSPFWTPSSVRAVTNEVRAATPPSSSGSAAISSPGLTVRPIPARIEKG